MHPILIRMGPIHIYSYGLMFAIAFALSSYLVWRSAPSFGIGRPKIMDLMIWLLISGIIGARILHVAVNLGYYRHKPLEILNLTSGGLAFYGGLILALTTGAIFIKKKGMPLFKTVDLIAPYLALGQSIGRIGCFFNGCCYGKESGFGVVFSDGVVRHPAQLYSSFVLLMIFLSLRHIQAKGIFEGGIFLLYIIFYTLARFLMDFLRADTPIYLKYFTASQIISIPIFISALYLFVKWKNIKSR